MLILSFDSSGTAGSVALLDGPRVLAERLLDATRGSAQTLVPAIVELLKSQHFEPSRIRLVVTTTGPGSFTGLRVGIATAKAFAYAVGAEVIGMSTLETIANQTPRKLFADEPREIHAVLDAQRRELFVARFEGQPASVAAGEERWLTRVDVDRILSADAWLASLTGRVIVTGAGLARLEDRLPAGVIVVPRPMWNPRAATVGQLAWRAYERGRREDLWKLAPVYLRPSYAEEKASERR